MKYINLLDDLLAFHYDNKDVRYLAEHLHRDKFADVDQLVFFAALRHLWKTGYLEVIYNKNENEYYWGYGITIPGIFFLEEALVKRRPYYSLREKEKRAKTYTLLKTAAVALNAVALLVISALALWIQFKDDDKVQKVELVQSTKGVKN